MSAVPARAAENVGGRGAKRRRASPLEREGTLAYLLMTPGGLVLLLFMAYPFLLGLWLSLTDKFAGWPDYEYVGLFNFRWLWSDPIFRKTVENTFTYGVLTVPFKLLLGLGLALLLNQQFRFVRYLRAGLLLPWIVPTAISALAWLMIFDPVLSPVSLVLIDWGIIDDNINFLGDRANALASVCLANIWRGIPFFAVTILAGLQAVPDELHEAAALDGAGSVQRFFSVTLPVIRNIVLIATLFSIIWTFADFQLIYVLTKGGPANGTHIFGTFAYDIGMEAGDIGQAAAVSLYMFPPLTLLAILLLRFVRSED